MLVSNWFISIVISITGYGTQPRTFIYEIRRACFWHFCFIITIKICFYVDYENFE